jgi:hypothetical protein
VFDCDIGCLSIATAQATATISAAAELGKSAVLGGSIDPRPSMTDALMEKARQEATTARPLEKKRRKKRRAAMADLCAAAATAEDARAIVRKEKNRVAASASRDRKKTYVDTLEDALEILVSDKRSLRRKMHRAVDQLWVNDRIVRLSTLLPTSM